MISKEMKLRIKKNRKKYGIFLVLGAVAIVMLELSLDWQQDMGTPITENPSEMTSASAAK